MQKDTIRYLLCQAMHEIDHPDCVWDRVSDYILKAKTEIDKMKSKHLPTLSNKPNRAKGDE